MIMIFYHPSKMKFHFCQNEQFDFEIHHTYPAIEFQMLMHIKDNSLCLFILFWVNSVHMKTTCQFETSFWSKSQIWSYRKWNAYCLEFCFTSIHVSTNNEVTEQQSEISNWNEILYQFGVHSSFHLMWMYSYCENKQR